jgi:hypothetical protein
MPFILLAPIEAPTPVPQIIRPRSALPEVIAAATLRAMSGKSTGLGSCEPTSSISWPCSLRKASISAFMGKPAWSDPTTIFMARSLGSGSS